MVVRLLRLLRLLRLMNAEILMYIVPWDNDTMNSPLSNTGQFFKTPPNTAGRQRDFIFISFDIFAFSTFSFVRSDLTRT